MCDLTTDRCCICLDKRPEGEIYYKNEDGNGMRSIRTTRWMHYCGRCQERAKPKVIQMKKVDTIGTKKANTKKGITALYALLRTNTRSTTTTDGTFSSATISPVTSLTNEVPVTPKYDSPADSDIADYEVISLADASLDEKAMLIVKGVHGVQNKNRRGWFAFLRKS
jgi:hypothetical protein